MKKGSESLRGRARGLDRRGVPLRVHHQAQRQPLRLAVRRRGRHAIDGRENPALAEGFGQCIGFARLALELKLHQTVERNGHNRLALDVDAELAHVPSDHAGKARGRRADPSR